MSNNLVTILRVSHKKTIDELAASLKISVTKYLNIEAGKAKLTPAQAIILSEIYFVEAKVFLADELPTVNINAGSQNRMVVNLYSNKYYEHPDDDTGEEGDE